MKTKLVLIATSGDMSKNGMGNKNTVVPFDSAYLKEVKKFLRDQLELNLYNMSEDNSSNFSELYENATTSFRKLLDLGIMESKYDFRSSWELSFNDHDEIKSYGKYQIREAA